MSETTRISHRDLNYAAHLQVVAEAHWRLNEDEDIEAIAQGWARGVPASTFAAYRAAEHGADLSEVLPKIDIPVLVTNQVFPRVDSRVEGLPR